MESSKQQNNPLFLDDGSGGINTVWRTGIFNYPAVPACDTNYIFMPRIKSWNNNTTRTRNIVNNPHRYFYVKCLVFYARSNSTVSFSINHFFATIKTRVNENQSRNTSRNWGFLHQEQTRISCVIPFRFAPGNLAKLSVNMPRRQTVLHHRN